MKKIFTSISLLAFALLSIGSAMAQTTVPALILTNQVWDISGSPYLINQNTYIDEAVSVKIMPGVEVLSLNKSITLQVDGELQALGTFDSTIFIDQLQINLTQKATPYDSATGTGALFQYCTLTSTGVGKQVISINGISVKIENATFLHTYYSLYMMQVSQTASRVDVINCTFTDSTGMSYPIYSTSSNIDLYVVGNTFNNFGKGGGMYLYAKNLHFINNNVNGQNQVTINAKASNISCNLFKNLRSGVELTISETDTLKSCIFTHNTLDSIGNTLFNDPMLKLSKSTIHKLNQSRFNNNNFLTLIGLNAKVLITGGGTTPTTSEPVNLKNNYWASTDSTTIEGFIKDYADDIKIFGRADFSGFLSNLDTVCDDSVGTSCHASYYLAVDTSSPFNLYIVNTSSGTSSSTAYTWDFGDGFVSYDENPSHTYATFGKFYLCVTLFNAGENCYSTYCDSIGIDSNGMLLKNGAFTVFVVNESDITSINQSDEFEAVRLYPNPSQGKIMLELAQADAETINISVMDLAGRVVHTSHTAGAQQISLDLSALKEGLYLLTLQKGQKIYTTKIVISR